MSVILRVGGLYRYVGRPDLRSRLILSPLTRTKLETVDQLGAWLAERQYAVSPETGETLICVRFNVMHKISRIEFWAHFITGSGKPAEKFLGKVPIALLTKPSDVPISASDPLWDSYKQVNDLEELATG